MFPIWCRDELQEDECTKSFSSGWSVRSPVIGDCGSLKINTVCCHAIGFFQWFSGNSLGFFNQKILLQCSTVEPNGDTICIRSISSFLFNLLLLEIFFYHIKHSIELVVVWISSYRWKITDYTYEVFWIHSLKRWVISIEGAKIVKTGYYPYWSNFFNLIMSNFNVSSDKLSAFHTFPNIIIASSFSLKSHPRFWIVWTLSNTPALCNHYPLQLLCPMSRLMQRSRPQCTWRLQPPPRQPS